MFGLAGLLGGWIEAFDRAARRDWTALIHSTSAILHAFVVAAAGYVCLYMLGSSVVDRDHRHGFQFFTETLFILALIAFPPFWGCMAASRWGKKVSACCGTLIALFLAFFWLLAEPRDRGYVNPPRAFALQIVVILSIANIGACGAAHVLCQLRDEDTDNERGVFAIIGHMLIRPVFLIGFLLFLVLLYLGQPSGSGFVPDNGNFFECVIFSLLLVVEAIFVGLALSRGEK